MTSRRHSGGIWLIFPTDLDFYRVGMSCKMMLLPKCQDEYVAKLEAVPELNMFFNVCSIFWWWLQIVVFDGNGIAQNFLKGINMNISIAWKTGNFLFVFESCWSWIFESLEVPGDLNGFLPIFKQPVFRWFQEAIFCLLDSKEVAARELASE